MIKKILKQEAKKSVVICHDPSITGWGFVVVDLNENILEVGCIKTEPNAAKLRIRKGDDLIHRIAKINEVLLGLIEKYNVKYMATELPHGSQSAVSAVMVGCVAGMAQTMAQTLKIPIEYYSEGDSKMSLLGKRAASKKETIQAIANIYDVPFENVGYKDEAIADAMSIYHLAKSESQIMCYLM